MIQLQIISECYMYFLKFSKIVTDKNTNLVQNVYIVTHGSCDILKYHYKTLICEIYMLMHTFNALD